jgi:serine-type D-Ala-D-Ala carboxypeptidase/endopeptidase
MKSMALSVLIAFIAVSLSRPPGTLRADTVARPPLPGKKEPADVVGSAVKRAAEAFLENPQAVGLSIGVLKDGKAVTYHFGTTERGKQHVPNARTLYAIGSITKTFTGVLLAQAVVEKKLQFDDDVRKYLDGDYPNLEYQGQPVRLWQLINHTSGLPRSLPEKFEELIRQEPDAAQRTVKETTLLEGYTQEDFFRDLHSAQLTRVPGEKFSYSNAAAQLLGLVLERIYGKSYEELVRIKIAGPLKMTDTKVTLNRAQMARYPMAYSASGAFRPFLSTRFPAAGSLKSTVSDMLQYLKWHIAESDEAVKLSHQPAGNTVWSQDNSYSVGLNWQILRSADQRVLWQDGTLPGFHCMCVLYPESKMGIIVLSNEEDRAMPTNLSPLVNQILKAIDPRVIAVP